VQAALTSLAAFATGATLPLGVAVLAPQSHVGAAVAGAALFSLAMLGAVSSRLGGAPLWRGALRITFWGALAMILTGAIGSLVGLLI
jgi:VIT1/CCC1 family predicted Fe2+/Mn2+ transporter